MMVGVLVLLVTAAVNCTVTCWAAKKAYALGHMDGWDAASQLMYDMRREAYPEFCEVERDAAMRRHDGQEN